MMKKKMILGAALCATMIFGGLTSLAQDNAAACPQAATCAGQGCAPQSCPANRPCPFDGIELTEAQQAQLAQLRQEQQQQQQATRDQKKKKGERRTAARREYLAKLKAILTPEQYVTYLENVAVQGWSKPDKGQKRGSAACGQQGQRPQGQRGNRPQGQRPQAPAAPQQ